MNPFPDKKYQIIYADPPWWYPERKNTKTKFGKGADSHYPLMKNEEIWNLPVQDITEENAALFLWVTGPRLDVGIRTVTEWGFRYATIAFTWVKQNPKTPTLFSGPGHYTKSNVELVLIGIKGSMPVDRRDIKQVLIAPRSVHSKKPIEIRKRIELMYQERTYIEMFARVSSAGWDVWGNETDKFDEQPDDQSLVF